MNGPYDSTHYDPPAPVLDVFLSAAGDPHMRIGALALVDTGADVSVIGPGIASRLGLPLVGFMEVAGVNDVPEPVPVWHVSVDIGSGRSFEVEAIEIGATTILGRDILNQLSVHCDGPKRTIDVR